MFKFIIYFSIYLGLILSVFYILSILSEKPKKKVSLDEIGYPFVSIIIPAYNEEKGISKTIESAKNLDYPKDRFEIIVIDDGSKDNTFKIASKYISKRVSVFKMPKNSGKGKAMNYGIKKSKGEFIVTMDADNTLVKKDSLIKMIPHFISDKEVMCVTPSMAVYKPKGILQGIQQIEYLFGIFLRKSFGVLDSLHITPGAFSAYRKSFFEKHGYFADDNLTEDMEMALRIQSNNYRLISEPNALVYTIVPNKFVPLLKQRRRWYVGLLDNFNKYRKLFSKKYGVMGLIVLPTALISILTTIILVFFGILKTFSDIRREIILLSSINFDVFSIFEFNLFILKRFLFLFFGNPLTIFFIILSFFLIGFLLFAKSKAPEYKFGLNFIFFFIFFSLFFAFWWIVSIFYFLFNKKVSWR